ncbi:unnamed protein product [Chondrus crispus]|uniref:Uncharacterized protein n=1 Tax=Chondrus crispus TaxID=2769 RepID=R7QIL4_CHOCR|nr:unnamed protein product [Chondrus crispus]CDF37583.1 unnamed protein product [Chondrus crispus]|eukprot:XP_005717454.1 unnamed protein product [Chondrus crispus]
MIPCTATSSSAALKLATVHAAVVIMLRSAACPGYQPRLYTTHATDRLESARKSNSSWLRSYSRSSPIGTPRPLSSMYRARVSSTAVAWMSMAYTTPSPPTRCPSVIVSDPRPAVVSIATGRSVRSIAVRQHSRANGRPCLSCSRVDRLSASGARGEAMDEDARRRHVHGQRRMEGRAISRNACIERPPRGGVDHQRAKAAYFMVSHVRDEGNGSRSKMHGSEIKLASGGCVW